MKKLLFICSILVGNLSAIELGKIPNVVTISGENGGKLDTSSWDTSTLKGKIHTVFYVDPDKKDLNNPLTNALKARRFDRNKVAYVAIINLAATWLPNSLIESKLKENQKKFPHTLYIKDKKKVLVKQWGLADDNSDILIFDKKGKLIYKKFGKISEKEIPEVLKLIEKNI